MSGEQFNRDPTSAPSGAEAGILVRSFRSPDHPHVLRLYHEGLLAGRVDPGDRTVDLVDIEGTYFRRPQDHFWVAETNGVVMGTVAISQDDAGATHLRRLRVAPVWQRDGSVPLQLIRVAINHARSHGCLKLVFHTSLDGEDAVRLLNRLGFQFARIRDIGGRHLVEFYDNLYATGDLPTPAPDVDWHPHGSAGPMGF